MLTRMQTAFDLDLDHASGLAGLTECLFQRASACLGYYDPVRAPNALFTRETEKTKRGLVRDHDAPVDVNRIEYLPELIVVRGQRGKFRNAKQRAACENRAPKVICRCDAVNERACRLQCSRQSALQPTVALNDPTSAQARVRGL